MNHYQQYQMMKPIDREVAQLYSIAGTQRFLYKKYAEDVTVVQLNEAGEFMGSGDLNKEAARALWDMLVTRGWSTKRMAA